MDQGEKAWETKMVSRAVCGAAPANDQRSSNGQDDAARRQLDQVVLNIARLIGRRMAREHFEALRAANDNKPQRDG